jgi:hypothetical protein
LRRPTYQEDSFEALVLNTYGSGLNELFFKPYLMADELLARGVRYVQTDYRAAYIIDFLTDERVTATATDYMRILTYDLEVTRHLDRAVVLSRQPCSGGEPIRSWHLCKVPETR